MALISLRNLSISFASFVLFTSTLSANEQATVRIEKADGRSCPGALIGSGIVATAAHCLDNLTTGGLRWQGERSTSVIVSSSVRHRGSVSNDDDFAVLVFSRGGQPAQLDRSRHSRGARVRVVTYRGSRPYSLDKVVEGYNSNSTRTHDIYLSVRWNGTLTPGDSGAPVFNSRGQYIGALRGCTASICGFFSVHHGNPIADEVIAEAQRLYPDRFTSTSPSRSPAPQPRPRPTPQPRPAPVSYFACEAQCRIEYRHPSHVVMQEVRDSYIRATSAYDAAAQSQPRLRSNCQEFCLFSRDAYDCRLTTSPICRSSGGF